MRAPDAESNDTEIETGCWAEEVAAPYYFYQSKGYDISIASMKGGEVPFDEGSLNPPFLTKEVKEMLLDEVIMAKLTQSLDISRSLPL